jgi:hypothetical protein
MQMDKKQTSLLALTVLAFGFLGYQVYQLIGSDLSQTVPAAPSAKLVSSPPTSSASASSASTVPLGGGSLAHVDTQPTANAAAATPVLASKLPTVDRPPLLKSQQQYLELLNQYELLKMRRQMLEEQAAIAQAQNRIAVLNDQTRKLDVSVNTDASGNYTPSPQANNSARYQLSYIDQQNGQWTASIYHDGVYQVVNNGSQLADGSTVMSISQEGVILQNKNKRSLISFNGVVNLPSQTPTPIPGQMPTKMGLAANPTPVPLKVAVVPKPQPKPEPKPIQYSWQARTIFSLDPSDNPDGPVLDEHKVLSIPKGHFTIQLMGSYNKDVVDNFVKANDLKGKAFLYAVPSRDKYWYILILGDYSDLAHAKTALANMPSELKARGSWIRQYGEIQNMMRG